MFFNEEGDDGPGVDRVKEEEEREQEQRDGNVKKKKPRVRIVMNDGQERTENADGCDEAETARKLADHSHSLHVAPGENRIPIALFLEEYAEELAFPTIYLGVPRKITGPCPTPFVKASSEIRRTDRRGATPEHVLYMAVKVMRYNVAEMTMTFRTNAATDSITREQLENGGQRFLDDRLDRDLGFMRGVPNTVQYWQERRKDLFAMIRQLGKPHAFLSMSASEVHWERLLETLERLRVGPEGTARVVAEMMAWERVELVNNDPVTCAIYTNRIFEVTMNVLRDKRCSSFRPYVVRDYFKRVEFQQRGSAHVHVILWLEDAPEDEELSGAEGAMPKTLEMVDALLTLDTSLLKRPRKQTHQHTHTCYKRGRTKCRFGAPFMSSGSTKGRILKHAETIRERERRKDLKAKYEEMHEALERGGDVASLDDFLRTFNVRSEEEYMDVLGAGVARPSYWTTTRVPRTLWSYVNKADRGMSNLKRAVSNILKENPNDDYEAVIRKLRVDMLKGVEMSAQEAAWFLLRQDMSHKSRDVVYIPTCFPEERVRVRKMREELYKLPAASTDVWKLNNVQKYEARQQPDELDDVCLADFASKYRMGQGGRYVPRDRPVVIRYRNYSPGDDVDSYIREQVLLYVPFRSDAIDVLDGNKYVKLYEDNKELIERKRKEYNPANDDVVVGELVGEYYAEMLRMRQEQEEQQQQREEQSDDSDVNEVVTAVSKQQQQEQQRQRAVDADVLPSDRLLRLIKETVTPSGAVRKRQGVMDRDAYLSMMRSTNAEQYELLREILHRQTTPGQPPLRVFFTGPAGCGKTFVPKLAMDVYNRCSGGGGDSVMEVDAPSTSSSALAPVTSSYNAYVIFASTGKAAVAVGGTTVHAAFKLVRSATTAGRQAARIGIMGDGGLSPSDLNTFRVAFRRVKCVIIDEVSMISADQLRAVDCRLRQITQRLNEPFGGLDVILCGDLRQLPPVRASEIYKRGRSADGLIGHTVVTWHHQDYFPLVRVVRQSDIGFSNVLTNIGDGRALEPDEVRLLESRFVTAAEAMERAPTAVRIFYSNNEVTRFNEAIAQAQGDGGYRTLRARDEFLGCKTPHLLENAKRRVERMVSSEFANLPREVLVVIGKPYRITSNIDVVDGLVNGAVGVLRMCEFEQGGEEEEGGERRARRLWLEFDVPGTGKLTRARANRAVREAKSNGCVIRSVTWVPIEMQSLTLTIDRKAGIAFKRTQFPLVQASAITVRKSQGGTYASVVYEYARTHPHKLVYVALSRYHTFYHREANPDKPMVDEFRRPESHHLHTVTQRYLAALKEQELSRVCEGGSREFTLALLNVRSLSAHALDVARNPVLGKVDLLCLTETGNNGTAAGSGCEDAVVRGYDAAACARAVATRRAGGVDVFLKRYLPFSEELRQQRQSSLLVLDRRVCPSVSGGLYDDGADDAVNE
ncbi:uncharacterized protein LOC119449071 [Dermacentor silvarum]|uniref:uncharacterized protein LOC119449071 n=1 Tax=Dermacentor silvarum TaxID=543639 RepID=UPI002100742B|nr:uncharacterized protein LOC119449071 [Dermacentor silvarum]